MGGGGYEQLLLLQGEYGCLVNKNGPLARRKAVAQEDLRNYYFIAPNLREMREQPEFMAPVLQDIIKIASFNKTVQVETVSNVIELLRKYPEGYVIACYPACKRYESVASGELLYLPFQNYEAKVNVCLFYERQAYRQYSVLRELIQAVRAAAAQFLTGQEGR